MNLGATYTVNVTVSVSGTATGGSLGGNASAYFLPSQILNEALTEGPATLNANSGSTFPYAPSDFSYRNLYSMWSIAGVGRQPPGMSFSNITFRVVRLRLSFTDTSGLTSIVQVLDRLGTMPVPLHLNSFTLPTSQTSQPYSPGDVRNGLFFNGDPRLNHNPAQWISAQLTDASADSTSPPESNPAVNVFSGMSQPEGDGEQGVPSNHTWYSSPNTANHFFVRSPPLITSNPATTPYDATANPNGQAAMESVAEIGYLSTGRPWQTLRMVVDPENAGAGGDYSILDFLDTGTLPTSNQTFTFNGTSSNQTFVNGKVNPNTSLRPTARGLFQGIPDLSTSETQSIAETLATEQSPPGYPYTRAGALGALTLMATPGATTKFAREDLMRRTSNLITTQSSDFTVLSHGEVINPSDGKVISQSNLLATFRLAYDSNGNVILTQPEKTFQEICAE